MPEPAQWIPRSAFTAALIALTASAAEAQNARTVFSSDFTNGASEHWSNRAVDTTPNGQRKFLGRFSNESVRLSLDRLPTHARVRIRFDLYIIQSWDGNDPGAGPDILELTVDHGPRLLYSTFSNHINIPEKQASFPGIYGVDVAPAQTGAAEVSTLGYNFGANMDSVYHIQRTFSHQEKSISFVFAGLNLQGVGDESWGLNNVKIEVLDAVNSKDDPKVIAATWTGMEDDDPGKAMESVGKIVESGDAAISEIRKQMAAADALARDEKQVPLIRKLINELDADKFQTREVATAELKKLGDAAIPELMNALSPGASYELRSRIGELLEARNLTPYQAPLSPPTRRELRLIYALELIGTPLAKAMLRDLGARYQPGGSAVQEAAVEALVRLDGRADLLKSGSTTGK
jgi:hypothetical protein